MCTNAEGLLNKLPAVTTCLCGVTGVHSDDLMTSSCSLLFKNSEERTPTGVENGLGQVMVFHHIGDLKVLDGNPLIASSIGFSNVEVMISTLALDLEVCLSNVARCLAKPLTALLASAQLSLLTPECRGARAIETRIRNGMAFTIRQEGLEPNIDTDIRMLTRTGKVFSLRLRLADDKGVPMPICSQDKVNGFRFPFYRAMQLDLEQLAKFGRHDEVFLVFVQIHIFAILPELDTMPSVGLLEAGKATFLTQFFPGKEALQGFGEPVSEHLYRRGWYVFFALSLKLCFQFVLVGKGASLLILLLRYCSHLIIDTACFRQTGNELGMLFLIHEKTVLKCSHEGILQQHIRVAKRVVRLRRRPFTPTRRSAGPSGRFMVD